MILNRFVCHGAGIEQAKPSVKAGTAVGHRHRNRPTAWTQAAIWKLFASMLVNKLSTSLVSQTTQEPDRASHLQVSLQGQGGESLGEI